jgi:DNA-binding CsgD family transcriptional regulator
MGAENKRETASEQTSFAEWNAAIAQVVGALESEDLPRLLVEALETLIDHDAALVIAYRLGRKPLVLYEDLLADEHGVHVDGYLAGAYLLDPFYRASVEGTPAGLHRLADVAPEGFLESEYYRSYYIRTLQSDEVCFLTDHPDGWVTNISLGRESGAPPFDESDLEELRAPEPIVHGALRRHWAHRRQRHPESDAVSNLHAHVEAALTNFGRSALTKREYEVAQLLLRGHSTRSSARELGIAQETIRLHRKNVYAKLDVASQSELFVLFIDSLAHIADDLSGDPLERYEADG